MPGRGSAGYMLIAAMSCSEKLRPRRVGGRDVEGLGVRVVTLLSVQIMVVEANTPEVRGILEA